MPEAPFHGILHNDGNRELPHPNGTCPFLSGGSWVPQCEQAVALAKMRATIGWNIEEIIELICQDNDLSDESRYEYCPAFVQIMYHGYNTTFAKSNFPK